MTRKRGAGRPRPPLAAEIAKAAEGAAPSALHFTRYEGSELAVIARVTGAGACGIYVLEFNNGECYVGKSVNFSRRFYSHGRNTRHHEAWPDVAAFSFAPVPLEQLDAAERHMIATYRKRGVTLRNRTFDFGFTGPSNLDVVVSEETQQHWAAGAYSADLAAIVRAARRKPGPAPKLFTSRAGQAVLAEQGGQELHVADAVCSDLLEALLLLPDTVGLEGTYLDHHRLSRHRRRTLRHPQRGPARNGVLPAKNHLAGPALQRRARRCTRRHGEPSSRHPQARQR